MTNFYLLPSCSLRRAFGVALLIGGLQTTATAQVGLITALARTAVNVTMLATANHQWNEKGKGSYQLAEAAGWQPAQQMLLTNEGLQVGGRKDAEVYRLPQLGQVVMRTDTFAVVRDVQFPPAGKDKQAVPPTTVLGKRVWRRPQVELLEFASAGGPVPVLRFPDQRSLALPTKPQDFREAMLAVVSGHEALSNQLRTAPLDASHTRQILDVYLRTKPEGFNTAAIFAALPASAGTGK